MQQETGQSVGGRKRRFMRWRFFVRPKAATDGTTPTPEPPTAKSSWSISRSLKDVTLATFRRCLVEQDWKYLVIEGEPPHTAIDEAGEALYSDYLQMVGGADLAVMIERSRAISVISSRLQRLITLIAAARRVYSPVLLAELRSDGFKAEAARLEKADDEEYQCVLDKIESRLKGDEIKLERLLKAETPKQAKKTPEEMDNDFEMMIVAVEEMIGPGIDDTKITVYRFCTYLQRLQAKIEAHNKAMSNGRGTGK